MPVKICSVGVLVVAFVGSLLVGWSSPASGQAEQPEQRTLGSETLADLSDQRLVRALDVPGMPGMQVRWKSDTGSASEPGNRYMLRWETLEQNRDRPREGPLPDPTALQVYKFVVPQPKAR